MKVQDKMFTVNVLPLRHPFKCAFTFILHFSVFLFLTFFLGGLYFCVSLQVRNVQKQSSKKKTVSGG